MILQQTVTPDAVICAFFTHKITGRSRACVIVMTTEELIRRCKEGDRGAWGALYRTYSGKMFRVCLRIVGDEAQARDVLHDGFIVVFTSLGALREPRHVEAWMSRIMTNLALKAVESRNGCVPMDNVEADTLCVDDDCADGVVPFDDIMEMIDRLPDGYRRVFRLAVIDGLPHGEIARMLDIEPRSSSSQLARAKRALRCMVAEYRVRMGAVVVLLAVALALHLLDGQVGRRSAFVRQGADYTCPTLITKAERRETVAERRAGGMPATAVRRATAPLCDVADNARCGVEATPGMPDVADMPGIGILDGAVRLPDAPPLRKVEVAVNDAGGSARLFEGGRKWLFGLGSVAGHGSGGMAARVLRMISGGVGSGTRVNIETWEELAHYLTYDTGVGLTQEERYALLQIAYNNNGRIVTRKDFESPLQIGLDFSKRLTERWSLDFGLRFTRHTTNLLTGRADTTGITERQRTCFIGVPVSVSYRFLHNGRWNAYGTAGVALDIPFHGKSDVRFNLDNTVIYRSERRLGLPGLQWSASAGVGVSYDMAPGLQLFFSPKLTWYVPNGGKTETQWSDKPLQVAFPFGFRIVFD